MDIHKPKPWHGVREFLKEYAIIVVGVLTALGGEQIVEWAHRHEEVAAARDALHQEIAIDLRALTLASRDYDCYGRRLDAIAAWAKGQAPRPQGHSVLLAGLPSTNWDTVKVGAVAHMPLEERLGLATFYSGVDNQLGLIHQLRVDSQEMAGYLTREDLDPQEAHGLLRLVGATQAIRRVLSRNVPDMIALGRRLGVKPAAPNPVRESFVDEVCAAFPSPPKSGG
jgi:hypothetical protein